eukprot:6214498-Pleurochrysis_carterae.AAC.4
MLTPSQSHRFQKLNRATCATSLTFSQEAPQRTIRGWRGNDEPRRTRRPSRTNLLHASEFRRGHDAFLLRDLEAELGGVGERAGVKSGRLAVVPAGGDERVAVGVGRRKLLHRGAHRVEMEV